MLSCYANLFLHISHFQLSRLCEKCQTSACFGQCWPAWRSFLAFPLLCSLILIAMLLHVASFTTRISLCRSWTIYSLWRNLLNEWNDLCHCAYSFSSFNEWVTVQFVHWVVHLVLCVIVQIVQWVIEFVTWVLNLLVFSFRSVCWMSGSTLNKWVIIQPAISCCSWLT